MTLAIASLFDESFYTGRAATASVPLPYIAGINGRGYMLDFSFALGRRESLQHRSIPMLRSQADTSNQPAEHSINPEGLWRRTQNSWHRGAGQRWLDRESDVEEGSDSTRFWTSKGLDVFTKFQLSLLNDTEQRRSSANTNLQLLSLGTHDYLADGAALLYSTDGFDTSETTVTGTSGSTITSIATDGYTVYITDGSNIYTTTKGAASASSWSTFDSDVLGYVKGRLMSGHDSICSNITASGTKVDIVTPALNSDFRWVGFADGPGYIFMAGYSGDKSLIYRTAVKADGTGLDTGVVAGELPDGEIIRSIQGYLGFLVIGSDLGVRFAQVVDGNVILGDLIDTDSPVFCFEPQGRFVWYGLSNYDSTSTGLGRLDLRSLNGSAPAYASDLMATTQGAVTSVITSGNRRLFTVAGSGVWAETDTKVASGTIDSGLISYGIVDQKVAGFVAMTTKPLVGSVEVWFSLDEGDFTLIGTATDEDSTTTEFPTPQDLADVFEIRLVVNAADGSDTVGPQVSRYTGKANPAASTGHFLVAPIRLHEELLIGGVEEPCVPSQELAILDELRLTRRVVLYQEASSTYTVTVEAIEWLPESPGRGNEELNGVCVVTMKTFS